MAVNIFERYGIKEVANVYFEALDAEEGAGINAGDIVLYLDTLKVSTVETTASTTDARGGWGNSKLVSWDFGKEINVNLEDAVISWEEMRILLGGSAYSEANASAHKIVIRKNAEKVFTSSDDIAFPTGDGKTTYGKNHFPAEAPATYKWIDMTNGKRGTNADLTTKVQKPSAGETVRIRFFWEEEAGVSQPAQQIVIGADRFPGTYRVVGDALIRSEKTGSDDAFQFIINKAKMSSNVTLTMQAEGDPSTFNLSLTVLRDEDGNLIFSANFKNGLLKGYIEGIGNIALKKPENDQSN